MKNKTYDILKLISIIVTPMATFILTMSDIWGFQYGAEIAATVSAIGIFLGGLLKASSDKYWEGKDENPD